MIRDLPCELVQEVVELASVDSTNTYSLSMGRPGLLVLAREQTSGRGRKSRGWYSPPGSNIYMTLTVGKPDQRYPVLAGVALQEALSALIQGHRVEIKWPNDLIVHGRKICGILCESRQVITAIGIGINVNQLTWPDDIRKRACSLREVSGAELDLHMVVSRVLRSLDTWFSLFRTQGFARVREAFLTHGRLRDYLLTTEEGSPCTVEGLTMEGHLVIEEEGRQKTLVSESISISS
ncbi:MAG: biotin--[acetyl-CoA-carboxylase] ligase [Desulfomonilia bacterium]